MQEPGPTLSDIAMALAHPNTGLTSDYDLNPSVRAMLPAGRALRQAAVLIGLIDRPQGLCVILTRRSADLKHHPGQIAFPGGKVEPGDASTIAAALRETAEEVGLAPDQADVLGSLPAHETVTGFQVTPVVAAVSADFVPAPDDGEVAEVFEVPLAFVLDPAHLQIHHRSWRGTNRAYYVMPYGPYYIWGATARMLKAFGETLEAAQQLPVPAA